MRPPHVALLVLRQSYSGELQGQSELNVCFITIFFILLLTCHGYERLRRKAGNILNKIKQIYAM